MIEIESELSDRCQVDKREATMLQSRCFIFVDPHGNAINTEQLDHQSMDVVMKKFRRDYIPRFLREWIKIDTSIPKNGYPCDVIELKSFVHEHPDGQKFFTYGQLTVWLQGEISAEFKPVVFAVQLYDSMEEIKSRIRKSQFLPDDLELRSCLIQDQEKPQAKHWENGQRLQPNDTVMSRKFYEKDRCLLVKVIPEKVKCSTGPCSCMKLKFVFASSRVHLARPMNVSSCSSKLSRARL